MKKNGPKENPKCRKSSPSSKHFLKASSSQNSTSKSWKNIRAITLRCQTIIHLIAFSTKSQSKSQRSSQCQIIFLKNLKMNSETFMALFHQMRLSSTTGSYSWWKKLKPLFAIIPQFTFTNRRTF